jgi:hypothetical protein
MMALFLLLVAILVHPSSWADDPARKGTIPGMHARGTFEVNIIPQPPEEKAEGLTLGRMLFDKHFHGDLEAESKGQMLTGMTEVKGSGAYVAMERVSGVLHGRRGSFLLYHVGTMNRGAPELSVTVVPDSGTGDLSGISGTLEIIVAAGKHSYDFAYTFPEAQGANAH